MSENLWPITRNALFLLIAARSLACAGEPSEHALADQIVRGAGVKGGLCVHLGVTDGKLTAALGRGGTLIVHGLSADRGAVEKARALIRSQGLYGRVSVDHCGLKTLPYTENLVNLIVAAAPPDGVTMSEMLRVLCPGGVAYVKRPSGWSRTVKPRPKEMGDWTHYRHAADGNKVGRDRLAGPPARLRWVVGPTWSRRHPMKTLKAMVSAGGRLFYVYDEAPKNVAGPPRMSLIARDAHNGLLLWKRPLGNVYQTDELKGKHWGFPTAALVAAEDRVYAVLGPGAPLTALDAATGVVTKEYKEAPSPGRVLSHRGTLILTAKNWLGAIDAAAGKMLWSAAVSTRATLAADGKVFTHAGRNLVCRDLMTGRQAWTADISKWADTRGLRLCFYRDGRLFLGGGSYAKPHAVHAVSAADGKHLWTYKPVWGGTDIYLAAGLLWLKSTKLEGFKHGAQLGLDPATGDVKKRFAFPDYYPSGRGHARCYPNTATERYILLSSRGTDFVDIRTGKVHDMRAFCGDCGFGIVPANGLVYMAPNSCTCYNYLGGIRALAAKGEDRAEPDSERLERGPAFGAEIPGKTTPEDWPTYRYNAWRSGITPAKVPADVKPLWESTLGGRLSAPTVAAGSVYVARIDAHQVVALDAADGKPRWTFTAGGRVDSPPTIHAGLCLFGSRNGWVYCLRAADGALAWRFRAAPRERLIIAHGRLESAWPVHGSVLVKDGVVCFAAGRAPQLDGGVTAYALHARTGKLIWKRAFPALGDVLATCYYGGRAVNLGRYQIDFKTGKNFRRAGRPLVRPGSGFLNGSYAARRRWYNGTASAELMVFRTNTGYPKTYGFRGFARPHKDAMSVPGKGENSLFCYAARGKPAWSAKVPIRVRAMALAGDILFAAGPPDVAPLKDYWAAFDGRLGAELWAVSAKDGAKLAELKLKSVPVFDGLAAANGRLYLSTTTGTVVCLGAN